MTRYKIKAAAFRIPLFRMPHNLQEQFSLSSREYLQGWRKPLYIPYLADEGINVPWVAHNYWILVKDTEGEEEVIEAAHAFASQLTTDKEGNRIAKAVPVGRVNDFLMIHFLKKTQLDKHESWLEADPEDQIVMYGEKEEETDALKRWHRVKVSRAVLNSYQVPYSAFGLGWSVGLAQPIINSNSGYRTMGILMELPIYEFKHWQPGVDNTMIPEQDLIDLLEMVKELEATSGDQAPQYHDWTESVKTVLG